MMTEYHNGRTASSRARPTSLCNRCGNVRRNSRDISPGRGSWADRGRGLSLEVDGREGRRRHSSGDSIVKQTGSPIHCYIIPKANGPGILPGTSSTTYRESFRSPSSSRGFSRRVASAPTSPSSGTSILPQAPMRFPQQAANRASADGNAMSRLGSNNGNFGRSNTTYRDHFTWMS